VRPRQFRSSPRNRQSPCFSPPISDHAALSPFFPRAMRAAAPPSHVHNSRNRFLSLPQASTTNHRSVRNISVPGSTFLSKCFSLSRLLLDPAPRTRSVVTPPLNHRRTPQTQKALRSISVSKTKIKRRARFSYDHLLALFSCSHQSQSNHARPAPTSLPKFHPLTWSSPRVAGKIPPRIPTLEPARFAPPR